MWAASMAFAAPAPCWWTVQPVRSCLMFAVQADGASLETVESLADGETLHPLQEAFRREHGLQCGYCTPGILMTLKPFLAGQPGADRRRDSPGALGQSLPLYRLPADRGGGSSGRGNAARRRLMTTRLIGEPVERREDARLLTGRARFIDDIHLPGMLHAAVLRSPHAKARFTRIDARPRSRSPACTR